MSIFGTDVFGVLVSLRFLVSAVGGVFQEKTPNFLKIQSCLVNDVVFKISFLAYYVKVLISAPVADIEGKIVYDFSLKGDQEGFVGYKTLMVEMAFSRLQGWRMLISFNMEFTVNSSFSSSIHQFL